MTVTTDLTITGKVAQFGRGALADVSTKLLNQFVQQLETTVLAAPSPVAAAAQGAAAVGEVAEEGTAPALTAASADGPAAPTATSPTSANGDEPTVAVRRIIDAPEAEPVDLIGAAGVPIAKRVLPVLGGLVVVFLVIRWLRRR